jgi:hypothetical protein
LLSLRSHKCRIIGPKQCLYVACYPVERKDEAATLMQTLFDIPCKTVANFLNLTLTPSNQIIHPARYYAIFRDWDGKRSYSLEELKKREGLTLCKYLELDAVGRCRLGLTIDGCWWSTQTRTLTSSPRSS